MPYNLLLLPLLGGFLFLHWSYYFKFRAQRSDGYRLLAEAAVAGIVLLVISRLFIIVVSIRFGRGTGFERWWRDFSPFGYSFTGGLSLVLGPVFAFLLNRVIGKRKAQELEIRNRGDAFTQFLYEAERGKRLISITLDNRKWYAGFPAELPNLDPRETYFRILPVLSGYRHPDSLEITQTVSYRELIEGPNPNDFIFTIPIRDVKIANFFDEDVYSDYFAPNDSGGNGKGNGDGKASLAPAQAEDNEENIAISHTAMPKRTALLVIVCLGILHLIMGRSKSDGVSDRSPAAG